MIGMLIVFAVFTVIIGVGITVWRDMNQKERWNVMKTYAFGALCALLASVLLSVIVILF
jgi:drug/metabolite transporter (DMT)-like permease